MSVVYYRLPLKLGDVMKGTELPTCDLMQSITNNLELIVTTRFGEHRSDPSFGCEIWDLDFELIVSASLWEEKLRQSLMKSITSHEHRLSDIQVNVSVTDTERTNIVKQFTEIKKRVNITLTATIHKTGEPFRFTTHMFLSPLSMD